MKRFETRQTSAKSATKYTATQAVTCTLVSDVCKIIDEQLDSD